MQCAIFSSRALMWPPVPKHSSTDMFVVMRDGGGGEPWFKVMCVQLCSCYCTNPPRPISVKIKKTLWMAFLLQFSSKKNVALRFFFLRGGGHIVLICCFSICMYIYLTYTCTYCDHSLVQPLSFFITLWDIADLNLTGDSRNKKLVLSPTRLAFVYSSRLTMSFVSVKQFDIE